jgi:signal transduction histidine kinase
VLKELIKEKDKDLSQVTQQLINFNHELLQYSYTVSHNLRGPVARVLGLIDLHKNYSNEEEKKQIIELIQTSAHELDSIIGHLNKIIETRSDSFSVRETVKFSEEVKKIVSLLKGPIHDHKVKIITDFSAPEIFSVRQRINHILFTLISNAIQYRDPDQSPQIRIHTRAEKNQVVIEVEDNGRGIDLDLYRSDLFKPFKYFHPDTSGRGVGLYLAKLQAERLHGSMDVRSTPGKGSTFIVYLKDWSKQD